MLVFLVAFLLGVVSTVVALGYAAWRAVLYLHGSAKDAAPAGPQSASVPAAAQHQHSQDTSAADERATVDALTAAAVALDGPVRMSVEYRTEVDSVFSLRKRFMSDTPKETKAAKLRQNLLHLYANDLDSENVGTILLDGAVIDLFPLDLADNELWSPAFPIRVTHPSRSLYHGHHVVYLFVPIGVDKESWVIALRHGASWFNEERRKELRQTLRQDRAFLSGLQAYVTAADVNPQLRWMNALMGRLFWSANSGDGANKFFRNKLDTSLQRTLARKGKPPFLDYIKVQTITAGDHMPVFSVGGPVDFRPDGSLAVDVDVKFDGSVQVIVEALASVDIPYAKRIAVPLLLSVTLRKLTGKLRFLIKAPPTDRLWVGFHERPTMTLVVTPVVAETAVKFEFVRSFLERLLGDMLSVVMVLPFMDDYPLPEVPEHIVHAVAEPLPSLATSAAAAAAAPAVNSFDGAASPSPSAVTPLMPQPHSAPALAGPAASASSLVAGAADVPFDDDLSFDDAVDLGRGASRHARDSSSDSQSDQQAGAAAAGTGRRASLSGTAAAAGVGLVSASSAASGSISSSLTSASSASLVDRAALNAAELRRRAVNASSSLAQTVIAKANARLGKAPSLPGTGAGPAAAGHGPGPALGPVSPKRRQDSLSDMPTPSVDEVDGLGADAGHSGAASALGSGLSGTGSGLGALSGTGSGAGATSSHAAGSHPTSSHAASSHPADDSATSQPARVPPPLPPLTLAAPTAPIPVPAAAPVQLSPTSPSST